MERMTVTETPVELTNLSLEEFEEMLGDERPHLECCRVERFFCGRPYHPELAAHETDTPTDEICEKCLQILNDHACWRGHQHCPIPLLAGFVCPDA
jgi:hypothetical protein